MSDCPKCEEARRLLERLRDENPTLEQMFQFQADLRAFLDSRHAPWCEHCGAEHKPCPPVPVAYVHSSEPHDPPGPPVESFIPAVPRCKTCGQPWHNEPGECPEYPVREREVSDE